MKRANLHPNPLSGHSEDYPDPEDRADAPWHCGQCIGGWACADCHRLFSEPGDPRPDFE